MNTLPLFPQDDNPILKKCYKCKEFLPATLEFFYSNKYKKDGFSSECKTCDSARRKAHADAHKEQESQRAKRYRETHKEQKQARAKLYRKTHKEIIQAGNTRWNQSKSGKEYKRQWHENNKEEIGKKNSQYYHENREARIEKQKQYNQTHKARLHERKKIYRAVHRERLLEHKRQYYKTPHGRMVDRAHRHRRKAQKLAAGGNYTAQQLEQQKKNQKGKCYYCKAKLGKIYHVDHIVPLSRGGSNDISNIVLACPDCNLRKGAKLPHEWSDGGRLL